MKIDFNVRVTNCGKQESSLQLEISPADTVASIKHKISGVQLIPFLDQDMKYNQVVLDDTSKVLDCGIHQGDSVDLEVKASEATLAHQIGDLLETRDLTVDELGLLYCYKHGASIKQALKWLGHEISLQDFLVKQKTLSMKNGMVARVQTDSALKPFSVVDELVQILKDCPSDALETKDLCAKFLDKFGVQLSSLIGMRAGELLAKEKDSFVLHGRHGTRVSLIGGRKKESESSEDDSTQEQEPGMSPPPGLDLPTESDTQANAETAVCSSEYKKQFDVLHAAISAGSEDVQRKVNDFVGALSDRTFLDIDHVVIGGHVGRGTAISGLAVAEIVFFLRCLPLIGHTSWCPSLLKCIAATILADDDFCTSHGLLDVQVLVDHLAISFKEPHTILIKLFLSPVYESFQSLVQIQYEQSEHEPEAVASLFNPAFAKERTQFVLRQSSSVRKTIRLVKWWRDQQEWCSEMHRPSDDLLELVTIYSSVRTKPADQQQAIANCMSLMSRFNELRVVWSNYYGKDDVWTPLLRQRPLLMDPANPFINIADRHAFNPQQLMELAGSTHFFW